ncbi:MAG: purine-binding chemotaxis protein CheW [Granulosicoccus sp.]|jgi:purine-binding chemotaxis protein CheW
MGDEQWISFKVESETYVHSVDSIKEIIPYKLPVPVPGSDRCTEGILNVRGNIVTILSGHLLFGRNKPKAAGERRIIILEMGTDKVGVSVDSVADIICFQLEDVQWIDQRGVIKGTRQLDDQLYILTDFSNYTYINDMNK